MAVVEVHIGVWTQLSHDAHLPLIDAETRLQNGFVLLVFFVYLDAIVAAQPQPNLLAWNAKPIVCVDLCGVETLFEILDELVVQPFQIVTLEDAVGGLPIPVTMVDMIAIALVVVAHLVPFNTELLMALKRQIRRQSGVVVNGQGERLDVLVEDLLSLRVKSEE